MEVLAVLVNNMFTGTLDLSIWAARAAFVKIIVGKYKLT